MSNSSKLKKGKEKRPLIALITIKSYINIKPEDFLIMKHVHALANVQYIVLEISNSDSRNKGEYCGMPT